MLIRKGRNVIKIQLVSNCSDTITVTILWSETEVDDATHCASGSGRQSIDFDNCQTNMYVICPKVFNKKVNYNMVSQKCKYTH